MKYGIKNRILSLVLCISMLIPMFAQALPVYSVAETLNESDDLEVNIGKQAVFDWWPDFLLVDDPTRENITEIYDTDTKTAHTDGENYWYLYEQDETNHPGEPYIDAGELVMVVEDYYYDSDNGFHWYKVTGNDLPEILQEKPWILYCTDSDIETGYDPYLVIYEADEVIRIINAYLDGYTGGIRFVLSGPDALADATISITDYDEGYSVSSLAFVHEENGSWSNALKVEITKANGDYWTAADGNVGILYTKEQFAISTYENVSYGAAFLYVDEVVYSANVTENVYDASDIVYTNSGSSVIVFELLLESFEVIDKVGYFKDSAITTDTATGNQTVNVYNNNLTSGTFDFTSIPEYFTVEYGFTQQLTETAEDGTVTVLGEKNWYWISDGAILDPAYFLVPAESIAFVVSLTDADTGVTVSGKIPETAELVVAAPVDILNNIPAFVDPWFKEFASYSIWSYDISIKYTDENGTVQKWQPATGDTAVVNISNQWDIESFYHRTDVYHVLDETTQDHERFSSAYGTVNLCNDGSIEFATASFSTFIVANGDTETVSITTQDGDNHTKEHKGHIVYLEKGGNALVAISGVNDMSDFTIIDDTSGGTIVASSEGANCRITAADASVGDSCIFKWEWTSGGTTYTAEVLVVVVDPNDTTDYSGYHDEVIHHIQLNVEQVAVLVNGQAVETLDDVALGFTSSTEGTLTRVLDPDSAVGYYYTYTYTVPASGDIPSYDTTITLKIDETATYLDSSGNVVDVSTLDFIISDVLLVAGSGSEQDQVTFVGTFPKGLQTTNGNEVRYLLSIETSYYGENADFYGDRLSFSTSIGYWDDGNVCPGASMGDNSNNPNGGGGSGGIDVAEFSMGYTIENKTYYVVYSDFTKTILGDVLNDTALQNSTKQYTFTIYRRLLNPAEGAKNPWEEFDTFTITGDFTDGISQMTIATVAEKYDPANLGNYQFMLVETGNNIDGYSCNVAYGTANGIFTFQKVESSYTMYTYGSGNHTTVLYNYGNGTYKVVTNKVSTGYNSSTTKYESTFTTVNGTITHEKTTKTTVKNDHGGSQTSTSDSDWDTHVDNIASAAENTVGNMDFSGTNGTKNEGALVVYSATLSCTNTYEKVKTGLTVNKVVNGAGAPASEEFTVTITPTGSTTLSGSYNYYLDNAEEPSGSVTVTNGVLVVTISKGQSLYIDLPAGSYQIQETEGSTIGFTYDDTPYTRTLTTTTGAAVTITNIFSADATLGSLKISKEVVTESSNYSKPTGDSRADFTFTVTIGSADATYPYVVYESTGSVFYSGTLSLTGGKGNITLKDGQYAVVDGIKYGTAYTVEESVISGYTLKESSGTNGTIVAGSTVEASFVNTYKNPLTSLTIKKSGYSSYATIDPNQSFMFNVIGTADNVDLTVTVHGDGSITIDGLMVGYEYTVTELTDWSWRYKFSSWSVSGSIKTTDNADENGATITLGATGNEITFTNTRNENKWLDGDSWCNNIFK